MMLQMVTSIAMVLLAVSVVMLFYRVITGPTIPDRAVALDTIGVNVLALIVILSIKLGTPFFLDAALVLAILGFVGTSAMAKFIAKGVIIDRDRN